MEIELTKGGRFNLSKEAPDSKKTAVSLGWKINQGQRYDIDASVFMLGANGKVPDEKYFVSYNNIQSIDDSLKHLGGSKTRQGDGDEETVHVDLSKIDSAIQELVFVVTIHNGQEKKQNFSQVRNAFIKISNQETRKALVHYNLREAFSQETALEFGRLYKKNGEWRFQAVGEWYNTGLQSFVDQYTDETQQHNKGESQVKLPVTRQHKDTIQQPIDVTKKVDINLLKTKLNIVLQKKGISKDVARVALVLDISGSMSHQYSSGAVQAFLERIVPVASKLDDDRKLDVWFFGSTFKRTTPVRETNVDGYVNKECGEMKRALLVFKMPSLMLKLGGRNNEPIVIQDVIKKYTQEEPSKLPTFVVFLSDGGVTNESGIKKAIIDAAEYPIFWQFVGLAGSNYGILERLDTMSNRVVDNANFFHVDDLGKITDEQLYERLLNEFPSWMKQARAKGVLK